MSSAISAASATSGTRAARPRFPPAPCMVPPKPRCCLPTAKSTRSRGVHKRAALAGRPGRLMPHRQDPRRTAGTPRSRRARIRAQTPRSARATRSSTACATSIPRRPEHHRRDARRRVEPHVGAPRHAGRARRAAELRGRRRQHALRERTVFRSGRGLEDAAGPGDLDRPGRPPRRPPPTAASTAARATSSDSPTRTGARPSKTTRSGTDDDHSPPAILPTTSGYGSGSTAISGWATSRVVLALDRRQRGVDLHVAVDRRDAVQPLGRVRRDAVDGAR